MPALQIQLGLRWIIWPKAVFTGPWQLTVSSWPGSRLSFFTVSTKEISWVFTDNKFPKTNMSPVKVGLLAAKGKSSNHHFCRAYVSFREGMMHMCIKSCMEIAFFFWKFHFLIGLGSFTMAEVCAGGALLAFFLVLYCETHRKDLGQGGLGWVKSMDTLHWLQLCGDQVHMARARKMRKRFHSWIPASSRSEANYLVNFTKQPSSDQNPEFYWPIVGLITNWCRQPCESHSIIEWYCRVNAAHFRIRKERHWMDWNDGLFTHHTKTKIFWSFSHISLMSPKYLPRPSPFWGG